MVATSPPGDTSYNYNQSHNQLGQVCVFIDSGFIYLIKCVFKQQQQTEGTNKKNIR